MLTASAKTGRHVERLLVEAVALADRSRDADPDAAAQPLPVRCRRRPPAARRASAPRDHRLKLLFMTQTGERPPRFSIQVNSRARVTRDYAYYIENRLRDALPDGGRSRW